MSCLLPRRFGRPVGRSACSDAVVSSSFPRAATSALLAVLLALLAAGTAAADVPLHNFDDISTWGWADAPDRRLMFASDVPRPPRQLPRALPPDVDHALMAAVADLSDDFARTGLTVLRGAGLRIGELLDLELGCVVDYGSAGTWLRGRWAS